MTHIARFTDIDNVQEREEWGCIHCKSFAYRTITDVSDVSYNIDTIYEFHFGDEKDAMWFKLNWS